MIDGLFDLEEAGTNVRTEIVAGVTTFMTMSYIIFVQPAVLGAAGMNPGAVMVATCLSSAIAMLLMAVLTNYPIALAPAMGHNFFFSYIVVLTLGYSWRVALGSVFIAGLIFILLSTVGLREKLMIVLPDCLKNGIPVGIGLLIALVGLEWSGIVVGHQVTYVTLGNLKSAPTLLSVFGLFFIALLLALRIRGAILFGIIATSILGLLVGIIKFKGIVSAPPSIVPTVLKLQFPNVFKDPNLLTVIFIFLFLDMFDTIGTLIGVGQQSGLMVDGKLPRARQALLTDAISTSAAALLGTSTITAYIESASGISAGGRTGLTNIVTALLMVGAIFFHPIIEMVGAGYKIKDGVTLYPVIAPALIIVGGLMFKNIVNVEWDDFTESIPAFLTLIMMPLAFSITEGISIGVISYSLLKLFTGKRKEVHWLIYLFAILFIARYIWLTE
jgi:AGZA family xanthine/uracil permease-like MFS transporter